MTAKVQYTWSLAAITTLSGSITRGEAVFPLEPRATRPSLYISNGTHAGTGTLDISALHGTRNDFMGLSTFSHAVAATQITTGSTNQYNFRASSLDHQALGPYGKINYTSVASSGDNTWANVVIQFLADVIG